MVLLKLIDIIKNKISKKDMAKKDVGTESYWLMYKYTIGDKVVARKPLDTEEWPFWSEYMDEFDNKVLTISMRGTDDVNIYYRVIEDNGLYIYKESWLEPYCIDTEEEEEDIIAGDLRKLIV